MDSNQSSPAMVSDYPLSVEAEEDFEQLGGFEHCCAQADNILAEHGFQRGLFTKAEGERVRRGRNPARGEIVFAFDTGKSLRANIEELLEAWGRCNFSNRHRLKRRWVARTVSGNWKKRPQPPGGPTGRRAAPPIAGAPRRCGFPHPACDKHSPNDDAPCEG